MNDKIAKAHHGSSCVTKWLAGGAAAFAIAFLVAKNFASIRRYIRIEMM